MTWKKFGIIWLIAGLIVLSQVLVIVLVISLVDNKISRIFRAGGALAGGMGGVPWEVGEGWVLVRNTRDHDALVIVFSALQQTAYRDGAPVSAVRTEGRSNWWHIPAHGHLVFHAGPNSLETQNLRPEPFFLVHFVARKDVTEGYPQVCQPQLDQPTSKIELHNGCWAIDLVDDSNSWLQFQLRSFAFLDTEFRAQMQDVGSEALLPRRPAPLRSNDPSTPP